MTLTQLRYVLAIVDAELNITVAAERTHATQPGLSKQLKQLEDELGFLIFVRRGKSLIELSAAGREVVERARAVLAGADNIASFAANQRGEGQGELVIATTQTQARFVISPALKALKARYPEVVVRLNLFGDAEGAVSAVQGADIVVASAVEPPAAGDPFVPLYTWRRIALFPADHPLARLDESLRLDDLCGESLIGYDSALGSLRTLADAFGPSGGSDRFAYITHDIEVIRTYVQDGLGVGLVPEMAVAAGDRLSSAAVEGIPTCNAYARLPRDRVPRDFVLEFLSFLMPAATPRDLHRWLKAGATPGQFAPSPWPVWREACADKLETVRLAPPAARPVSERQSNVKLYE